MNTQKIKKLKKDVYMANMELYEKSLVISTFGNVSGIDRKSGIVAIKPSGVPYNKLSPEKMVLVDLNYQVLEGDLKPSSDTKTHVMLYKKFSEIGGVAHTHSIFATAWSQAQKPLPCLGTTHADYFYGNIPCTAIIRDEQIKKDYEEETAVQIIETFEKCDYTTMQGVLVAAHGPFTWGKTPSLAVFHSYIMECIAEMNMISISVNPEIKSIKQILLDKHFLRKHGKNAYYGQRE